MTTSGTYVYSRTAAQIITEALELIGAYAADETTSSSDSTTCLASLNMMIKAWQGEGIGLWTKRDAALFLEYGETDYLIGPSGDNVTSSWVKTEIATAADETDLTITVDDDEGIIDGDYIGIALDDGTLQWTTVSGTPAANVVTLAAALTDDAAVDNHVYTYTTKLARPVEIADMMLRDASGNERPITIKSRQEYMALPNKDDRGSINIVHYNPLLTNGKLYTWQACNDVHEYLKFTAKIPIENFDATTDTPDFPQEWLLPLSWNLAVNIAPKFGRILSPTFEMRAQAYKIAMSDFDREDNSIFITVGK
jgi:hypothetical protein